MIWEKFMSKSREGQVTPLPLPGGAHENKQSSPACPRIFNSYLHTYFWLFRLFQKKTNCNPLAHPTWKCHHTNLWIAKLFLLKVCCVLSNVGCPEVVGCHRWPRKELVVMCDESTMLTNSYVTVYVTPMARSLQPAVSHMTSISHVLPSLQPAVGQQHIVFYRRHLTHPNVPASLPTRERWQLSPAATDQLIGEGGQPAAWPPSPINWSAAVGLSCRRSRMDGDIHVLWTTVFWYFKLTITLGLLASPPLSIVTNVEQERRRQFAHAYGKLAGMLGRVRCRR